MTSMVASGGGHLTFVTQNGPQRAVALWGCGGGKSAASPLPADLSAVASEKAEAQWGCQVGPGAPKHDGIA